MRDRRGEVWIDSYENRNCIVLVLRSCECLGKSGIAHVVVSLNDDRYARCVGSLSTWYEGGEFIPMFEVSDFLERLT